MDSYEVIHAYPPDVNFSAYTYYQIYITAGSTLVYKGVNVPAPTTTGSEILNLTVSSASQLTNSDRIYLLGKKKPEQFHRGPAGENGLNTDGTWSIKG